MTPELPDLISAARKAQPSVSRQVVAFDPGTSGSEAGLAVVVGAAEDAITNGGWRAAVLCVDAAAVQDVLRIGAGVGETGRVRLVHGSVVWPGGEPSIMPAVALASDLGDGGRPLGSYTDQDGTQVVGAWYPLPDLGGGILVEQSQAEITQSTDSIAATLIALILGVALGTTAIAAVVIRQITRPVIDLTESAVAMAEGDLDQHLSVRSRDEIGILTYVFNDMAAQLKSLYEDLEAKVVERTRRLQEANTQIQRRALHLQASQEVSQAITSIRDPELLLMQVTDLIRNHFVYGAVAVYLVPPGGGEARLQAHAPQTAAPQTAAPQMAASGLRQRHLRRRHSLSPRGRAGEGAWPATVHIGDSSVVAATLRAGTATVYNEPALGEHDWYARMLSRAAVPLKMEDRVVGAIAVTATVHEGIEQDELEVLEVLANQVTIALENARTYERERQAIAQLEEAEAFKARFLANMSHELMEPLNTILGFSRLLIKGVEGPLNRRQREDLAQIHGDSQHLLDSIRDILSISQIEAGLLELRLQPVDFRELVAGVVPTASALVRGRAIELTYDVPADLPRLRADPSRLRQVLVHLLNNSAKFTESGEIRLRAWSAGGIGRLQQDVDGRCVIFVSVSDTGIGIPVEDRERIFSQFEKGGKRPRTAAGSGAGLGLALCREFVALHGGRMWVDSEVGVGSVFTFSVPAYCNGEEGSAAPGAGVA